jgi:catechol 2,3-dioxygenase-like lactoylglutathione lyase family enzyme
MAYRFLLEVPAVFAEDANAVVGSVDDAQVLVTRNSHGLGFDDTYVDLSIASHSLKVIPVLYDWASDIGATRQDSRIVVRVVLHDGRRIGLHEADAPAMVAAIRRDQPWVDRSMPKIGEHEPTEISRVRRRQAALAASGGAGITLAPDNQPQFPAVKSVIVERTAAEFTWNNDEYALVTVSNLASAERFYSDVLGLNLVCRLKQDEPGNWRELPLAYDHEEANYHNTEADRVLLEHGVLRLALARAGHGARLNYATVETHFSLLVEPDVLANLRATVLMRGYDLLEDTGRDITFRDPFGVAWSVTDSAANVDR